MIEAHKLVGFIAAHGIWSVSDGSTLIPIYAYSSESGERVLNRLATKFLEEAVELGKKKIDVNAFFEGVDSHEKAAKIWSEALDQSI